MYCFAKGQRERIINVHEEEQNDTLRCNSTGKNTRNRFPPSSGIEHTKEECLLQVLLGLKRL